MNNETFIKNVKSQRLLQSQYNILKEQKKIEKTKILREKRIAKKLATQVDEIFKPRVYYYIKPYFSRNENIN